MSSRWRDVEPSGRKRGGQARHKGHGRTRFEKVYGVAEHRPESSAAAGRTWLALRMSKPPADAGALTPARQRMRT